MNLVTPAFVKKHHPLNLSLKSQIDLHRQQIQDRISGISKSWMIVVGPCSLHHVDSAILYAEKIAELQKQLSPNLCLVMRAYLEKPRTYLGWKGFLRDPYIDGSEDVSSGLLLSRQLLLEIVNLGVPLATEFLDPLTSSYFSDLISWGFIGARTSASSVHRYLASLLPLPIGFKNGLDGSTIDAAFGALLAQQSHKFPHVNEEGCLYLATSNGNPHTHIVLRGSLFSQNYQSEQVNLAINSSQNLGLKAPLLIDCSHGNSKKNADFQKEVCIYALDQYRSGKEEIMGVMIESHLMGGSQNSLSDIDPYISITDPCLGWEETESLILECASKLETRIVF